MSFVDRDAAVSDDEEENVRRKAPQDDDEDSETDDHVPDQYEQNDGFIVGDDEVDEEEYDSHKRKRSHDDDGGGSKKKKRKKEFKRLKKRNKLDVELEALKQTSDDESRMVDNEEVHALNTNELRSNLFHDDDAMNYDEEEEQFQEAKKPKKKGREYEDDDMDNFIVRNRRGRMADDDDLFGDGYIPEIGFYDEQLEEKPADTRESLKQIFGPDEIAEQMMTEEDEKIRQTDIPERYQVKGTVREPSTDDIIHEAQWIYDQVFLERQYKTKKSSFEVDNYSSNYESGGASNDGSSWGGWSAQPSNDENNDQQSGWYSANNSEPQQNAETANQGWNNADSGWNSGWNSGGGSNMYDNGTQFDGADDGVDEEPTIEQKYVTAIIEVLKLILVSSYDIPFIAQYRKEYFAPVLKEADLWLIFEYDEKWFNLQAKKQHVTDLYREATSLPFSLDFYSALLKEAKTIEEVEDHISHYLLYVEKPQEGRKRRTSKRDLYSQAKKTKVKDFCKHFGIAAHQFAENLSRGYFLHDVQDPRDLPENMTNDFVTREYKNSEAVLKMGRFILAREIAAEPYVKRIIRNTYMAHGHLSVSLTLKGETIMNERLTSYKGYLKTPLDSFMSSDMLLPLMEMLRDERDGLIQISIGLSEDRFQEALDLSTTLFSRMPDQVAVAWNEQRKMVVTQVQELLTPVMEQFVRNHFMRKGRAKIGRRCAKILMKTLYEGPVGHTHDYNPNKLLSYDLDDEEDNPRPTRYRIMSCCVGIDREMTTFVQLDADGQQKDVLQWKFSVFNNRHAETKQIQEAQENDLKDFIIRNNPHAVAVATSGLSATKLFQTVNSMLEDLKSRRQIRSSVRAYYVADDYAKIYEVSQRASKEFPKSSSVVRRAVSVGRRLNDPLTEIAGLFNYQNDILCYKFHPLQDLLPNDQLAYYLEVAATQTVNKVGVDINRMSAFKNLQSTLRFVSGLGPRKADGIVKALASRSRGYITRRKALVEPTDQGGLGVGKVVFFNCAGFIRVVPPPGVPHSEFDVMDNTRIHFESNKLALKVAMDALDIEDEDEEDEIQSSIENVMKAPEKLDDLDLVSYADALEERKIGKKHATLNDIRDELKDPYKDPRNPFVDLLDRNGTEKEVEERKNLLFNYLTGETDETFKKGMIVPVMIQRAIDDKRMRDDNNSSEPQKYFCQLDNGLKGILRTIETEKEIKPGATIDCTIEDIDKDTFTVVLACRDSVIEQMKQEEKDKLAKPSRARAKRPKKQIKRNIQNPLYRNFNYNQALTHLADKPPGETVIRPSSKGADHLAVTFKFYNDLVINLDIKEEDKVDQASLGRRLRLKDRTYSDLDEISVHFVQPVMEHSKKIIEHPKFSDKPMEVIEKELQQEKQKNPKSIPYRIGLYAKYPGRFLILFMPNKRMKKQGVSVSPDGYVFNQRTFGSITQLLNSFKKTYSAVQGVKVQGSSSSSRSSGSSWNH